MTPTACCRSFTLLTSAADLQDTGFSQTTPLRWFMVSLLLSLTSREPGEPEILQGVEQPEGKREGAGAPPLSDGGMPAGQERDAPVARLVVGIAVSTAALDVAQRPNGEPCRVANEEAGIAELVDRLRPLGLS
jgi:hypothetical protein